MNAPLVGAEVHPGRRLQAPLGLPSRHAASRPESQYRMTFMKPALRCWWLLLSTRWRPGLDETKFSTCRTAIPGDDFTADIARGHSGNRA